MAMLDFYVGSYSRSLEGNPANGAGIYRCRLDPETGEIGTPACVAECINPSYLTWGRGRKYIYATREMLAGNTPGIMAFSCAQGALTHLNSQPLTGGAPCHLSVHPSGRYLASAQYETGDVAIFKLNNDGSIGSLQQHIQHNGQSINSARQAGPHAHFVHFTPDSNYLEVVDLGLDQIFTYPFDTQAYLENGAVLKLPAGAGPRHLTHISDKYMAVMNELNEHVALFERGPGQWQEKYNIQAFDALNGADGMGAAIRCSLDGRFLYVSGRIKSEIACFAIETSGTLRLIQRISTGGEFPRDFALSPDGQYIIVANQLSNNLTCFHIDPQNGKLENTGFSVELGSPTCVLWG
ncbi:MAG: lactonase family protein [Paracoccaceae bacterium]